MAGPISNGKIPAYHASRLGPDHWALRHGDDVVSWGELDRRSTRRAWALKAAGVGKDDFVTLSVPNSSALYELTFALWKLGAAPHVVSWRLPRAELAAILEVARPKLVIASDSALREGVGAKPAEFGLSESNEDPLPDAIATYWKAMSSGGSTGRPKIIVDHKPSTTNPDARDFLELPHDGGVILNPGPLYHNAPFAMTHYGLFRGASIVGMAKFDAEEALRLISEYKVQWVNLVPTMMQRIWRLPEEVKARYDISSLEWVWHMASPMPPWLKMEWIELVGAEKLLELYGGTESQGLTLITGTEWLEHRGSVGRPVNCKVRVLDDAGRDLPPHEVGEIFLLPDSGAGTTYHYVGAQPKQVDGGWESLGDFGWMDEDGYLYIADRRTDMILSGGANVYPAEIESALMEHPKVEVAVAVGLPHEDLGATVHAIVKPTDEAMGALTHEDLAAFLSERLARYKIPRSFEFTTERLRDDAGKARRTQLRDERIARAAQASQ